jgi:serine/threonine-protein kinase HipA
MARLDLDVRIDGFAAPAGTLTRNEAGGVSFQYSKFHLLDDDAPPLSLSLPLRDEPFGDPVSRAFFDNLLQEGTGALDRVMAREGLARDDIAGLLAHVGKDCPGAISVLPAGARPAKIPGDLATDYRRFDEAELVAIVQSLLERRRLPDGLGDPSPLAGVQSKLGVTRLPGGDLAEPIPGRGSSSPSS